MGIKYKAIRAIEEPNGQFRREIQELDTDQLPDHDVLIRVKYSALNYKDALSASGNKGITKNFPHTPGIDASGIVEECKSGKFNAGDEVIVTSFDLGMNTPGGFGGFIKVPAEWVVPKPDVFTLEESMILGTGGFTAALALELIEKNGQTPAQGPVLVTGATGGVGSMAVSLLHKAGYSVIAATGKPGEADYLKGLGATEIIGREDVSDTSGRPLLGKKWAGAIDTVGGHILETVVKACGPYGNVAICGNVLSPEFSINVFPFILRGISLHGVETGGYPMEKRMELWNKLSGPWKIPGLREMATICSIDEMEEQILKILDGKTRGRIILKH